MSVSYVIKIVGCLLSFMLIVSGLTCPPVRGESGQRNVGRGENPLSRYRAYYIENKRI